MHTHSSYLDNRERTSRAYAVGNIKDTDLKDLWSDPEYVALRRRVQAFEFSPCTLCGGMPSLRGQRSRLLRKYLSHVWRLPLGARCDPLPVRRRDRVLKVARAGTPVYGQAVNAAPRFRSGSVELDSVDLRRISSAERVCEARRTVLIVLHDAYLFCDIIHGNVRYGYPEADDAAVESAARRALAHAFIASLPNGYDVHSVPLLDGAPG